MNLRLSKLHKGKTDRRKKSILENFHIILRETGKEEELLYVIPGVYCYLTLNYTISVCYMEDGSGVARYRTVVQCSVVRVHVFAMLLPTKFQYNKKEIYFQQQMIRFNYIVIVQCTMYIQQLFCFLGLSRFGHFRLIWLLYSLFLSSFLSHYLFWFKIFGQREGLRLLLSAVSTMFSHTLRDGSSMVCR